MTAIVAIAATTVMAEDNSNERDDSSDETREIREMRGERELCCSG